MDDFIRQADVPDTNVGDTIYRHAAIDAIERTKTAQSPDGELYVAKINAEMNIQLLPSAQPDLSGYSDRLWRNAYERGKRDAQPQWIPFKLRPVTEEEKKEHPDWENILDCKLPDDGQRILVNIKYLGHEAVQMDEYFDDGGCYLDSGYEIATEATAWMPLPGPYKEERA